ncbi:MAG: hypothetical protein JXB38_21960, partial [Anaerolineales bacterium]|nr:hypothetical protein [Anaerolineales bacterium]
MARGNWIEVSGAVRQEDQDGVYSAAYQLDEIAAKGSIKTADWEQFQKQTGLADFYWRAYWRRGDIIAAGGREKLPTKAAAVVVFMHGWDGCGDIF